ncbi:tail fiber assembly protein [Photorhabdus temperata subsp. temperata]
MPSSLSSIEANEMIILLIYIEGHSLVTTITEMQSEAEKALLDWKRYLVLPNRADVSLASNIK